MVIIVKFKDCIKLLKFLISKGLMAKMMLVCMILFFLAGVLFGLNYRPAEIMSTSVMGGFYFVFLFVYLDQVLMSNLLSSLVIASPNRKMIEQKLRIIFIIAIQLFFFSIYVVWQLLKLSRAENATVILSINASLIVTALIGAIMMVYSGIVYRYYKVGIIGMVVCMLPIIYIAMNPELLLGVLSIESTRNAVLIGYGIIAAGYAVVILLSRLLYNKPMCKTIFKNAINKAMQ